MSRLLHLALRAYPRARRERDGDVLLGCAEELVAAGSSTLREAAGLVVGGAVARSSATGFDVSHAPWGRALTALALPLSALNLALWALGLSRVWPDSGDLGKWWSLMAAASVLAFLGALMRRRAVSAFGWALTVLLAGQSILASLGQPTGRLEIPIGPIWLDFGAAFLPLIILGLVSSAWVRGPARARDLLWAAPALLVVVAGEPILLLVALLGAPVVAAVARGPVRDRAASAALLTAVAAPEAIWIALTPMPYPGPAGALLVLAALGVAASAAVLAIARRAGRPT